MLHGHLHTRALTNASPPRPTLEALRNVSRLLSNTRPHAVSLTLTHPATHPPIDSPQTDSEVLRNVSRLDTWVYHVPDDNMGGLKVGRA